MSNHSTPSRHPRLAGRRRRAGFTLVEIVIAFIIIGILTAIAVPTIARRSEDAKIASAQSDLQHLADALERVSIDIGPIVRIYALDDVLRSEDGLASTEPGDIIDALNDNEIDNPPNLYEQGELMFISNATQDFLQAQAQLTLFRKLVVDETSFSRWRGPYINWKRDANGNDWPDDPWGSDYLFFSRRGILYPPDPNATEQTLREDHTAVFETVGPSPGQGAPGRPAQIFDRFVVLSLGPNGLPGDGSEPTSEEDPGNYGRGDDIYHAFGGY
jgi:prepilin-type N-terminal cleavage/methylation domain-containing protein